MLSFIHLFIYFLTKMIHMMEKASAVIHPKNPHIIWSLDEMTTVQW